MPAKIDQDYAEFVLSRVKPGEDICKEFTPEKTDMLHAAIGISGEAGELLDAVKKHVIYNKPLDRENVIEELGDLEFYMEQMRQRICVTSEECIQANMDKLSKRYSNGKYTDKQASERADKNMCRVKSKALKPLSEPKEDQKVDPEHIPPSPKLHEVLNEMNEAMNKDQHVYKMGNGSWLIPDGAEREGASGKWTQSMNAGSPSMRGVRYRWKAR